MAIGPVQLIVLGFRHPDFHGRIIEELERLRESDTVRVIDALAVYKNAAGDLEAMHLSNLSQDEAIELGSKIGALIGLGFEGEDGMAAGAKAGAEAAAEGATVFSDEQAWDAWRTSRTTQRPRWSCSNTTGPSRCATPSSRPTASVSATGSSAPWTSSRSACSPTRGEGATRPRDSIGQHEMT